MTEEFFLVDARGTEITNPIEVLFARTWEEEFGIDDLFLLSPQVGIHFPTYDAKNPTRPLYVLDFSIRYIGSPDGYDAYLAGVPDPLIAIELDGHEWHERTRRQVDYRDARDRYLQMMGWVVLHYSGSALMRDPRLCVNQVHHYAAWRFSEMAKAIERVRS